MTETPVDQNRKDLDSFKPLPSDVHTDEKIARLESDLQDYQNKLKNLKFFFSIVTVIILNAWILQDPPWHKTLLFALFDVIFLKVAAVVFEFNHIDRELELAFKAVIRWFGRDQKEKGNEPLPDNKNDQDH